MTDKNLTVSVPLSGTPRGGEPVQLMIQGLKRTTGSISIRVFLGQPEADAATPVEGNQRYAGSIFVYGHGQADPSKERFPRRAAIQRQPYDHYLDVTGPLQELGDQGEVSISFVAVDQHGKGLSPELIEFERLALLPAD